MHRVGRGPRLRPARGLWPALLAVLALLAAPLLVSPAHAHGHAPEAGCGMDGPVHARPDARTRDQGAACAAACAVCAQLAPARAEAVVLPPRAAADGVRYARLELRPAGVEPEPGAPPPR